MKISKTIVLMSIVLGLISAGTIQAETLTLEQVIKEACTKSDSVKSMNLTLYKAKEMVREKWANALPTVSGSLMGARTRGRGMGGSSSSTFDTSLNTVPVNMGMLNAMMGGITDGMSKYGESWIYSSSLQINQPIWTFGKVDEAINVAREFELATKSNYASTMQNIQKSSVDMFYRVVMTQIAADIAQRSLDRKKELYEFMDRNFKMGAGAKAQILITLADYKSAGVALRQAQQDALTMKMMMNNFLGRPLNESIELDTTVTLPAVTSTATTDENSAIEQAYTNRSDLKSLDHYEQANRGGQKIFNAMYYPTIAATASLGTGGTEAKDLYDWDKHTYTVGLVLAWQFFDGFANNARANQYKADAEKLEIARSTFKKYIEIEIRSAVAECAMADSNATAFAEMLAASREAYTLINENFKQGSGQLAELQLADERLRQTELGAVAARYRQIKSRAALIVSTGNDIIKLEDK